MNKKLQGEYFMSMPEIPDIAPIIEVSSDDAINLQLIATGMQELSLAHVMNTQAEYMQFALGMTDESSGPMTIDQILEVSRSTRKMLRETARHQMLLTMGVEDLITLIQEKK